MSLMQSAVSRVTVGEALQLVFCHVNFYIREESRRRRRRAGSTGWRREEQFTFRNPVDVYKKPRPGLFFCASGSVRAILSYHRRTYEKRTDEVVDVECCCSRRSSSTPSSAPPIMFQMCFFNLLDVVLDERWTCMLLSFTQEVVILKMGTFCLCEKVVSLDSVPQFSVFFLLVKT